MAGLNEYLDKISFIKVLLFFLLAILLITLFDLVFDVVMGDLIFKLVLYSLMLVFFIYKLNSVKIDDSSWVDALKESCHSLFLKNHFYHICFIILANILFVAFIFFCLKYLSFLGYLSFDSYLFGDLSQFNPLVILIYFISIVLLSPIVEEILFRGFFLRRFCMEFGMTVGILLSSVLFGLCHSFGGILGAILFGICVSILYIKSNNIMVPIFAHFLNNLLSFLLGFTRLEFFVNSNLQVCLIVALAVITNVYLFASIIREWPKSFK